MTSFSDAFKKAGSTAATGDWMPAAGTYQVTITDASAFNGRDTRQWAKAVLAVAAGPDAGRRFDHFMNLNNEVGMRIARESLLAYGMNAAGLEDDDATIDTLHDAMQPLIGTSATVTVTHKGGFMNVHVEGARTAAPDIAPEPPAATTFATAAAADDDQDTIPWDD